MGRTDKVWAVQHGGVESDIVCSARGIASGMPLGALVARQSIMTWPHGVHGSTYAGNPLVCAAAPATIRLIENGLMDNAAQQGAFLLSRCLAVVIENFCPTTSHDAPPEASPPPEKLPCFDPLNLIC